MPDPRLLVMAKAPVPGSVKTRLRLDPARAARLQEALISDTVEKARGIFPSAPVTVAASPAESLEAVRSLLGPEPELVAQPEGDLGERMLARARELLAGGEASVLVLGTDAPTLPPGYIREAACSLRAENGHDAALVPSEDGGYVLIGLHAPRRALRGRGVVHAAGSGSDPRGRPPHRTLCVRDLSLVRRGRAGGPDSSEG